MDNLFQQNDNLWRNIVRKNANGQCQSCGFEGCQAHHIYKRSHLATRWMPENGIYLCTGCHTDDPRFSAHKTPKKFHEWLKINWRYYDMITKEYKNVVSGDIIYLKMCNEKLKSYKNINTSFCDSDISYHYDGFDW